MLENQFVDKGISNISNLIMNDKEVFELFLKVLIIKLLASDLTFKNYLYYFLDKSGTLLDTEKLEKFIKCIIENFNSSSFSIRRSSLEGNDNIIRGVLFSDEMGEGIEGFATEMAGIMDSSGIKLYPIIHSQLTKSFELDDTYVKIPNTAIFLLNEYIKWKLEDLKQKMVTSKWFYSISLSERALVEALVK